MLIYINAHLWGHKFGQKATEASTWSTLAAIKCLLNIGFYIHLETPI